MDNMQILSNMFSTRFELHSFSFELPIQTLGDGTLVRIAAAGRIRDGGRSGQSASFPL